MGVTVCHLLIIVIEFSSLFATLWDTHFQTPSLASTLPFLCNLPFLPFILGSLVHLHTCDACQPQLSHVATLVALSMDAPREMASTTMTWCASPATKAILWKGHQPRSARPTASGASSHRPAEVWSSHRAQTERLTWLAARAEWKYQKDADRFWHLK